MMHADMKIRGTKEIRFRRRVKEIFKIQSTLSKADIFRLAVSGIAKHLSYWEGFDLHLSIET